MNSRMKIIVLIMVVVFEFSASYEETAIVVSPQDTMIEVENPVVHELEKTFSSDIHVFIPTNQWQEILPGQHIPPGLDVTISMKTGVKKARLHQMDEKESAPKLLQEQEVDGEEEGRNKFVDIDLPLKFQQILNGLPKDIQDELLKRKVEPAMLPNVLQELWDARQAELSAAMDAQTSAPESMEKSLHCAADTELLETKRVQCLIDLEYYVTDIDFAKDMVNMNGMLVLAKMLNDAVETNLDFKSELLENTLWVLGTTMKHHEEYKDFAMSMGVFENVLAVFNHYYDGLRKTSISTRINIDPRATAVLSKVLYVISGTIRSHHSSSLTTLLHQYNGLKLLSELLVQEGSLLSMKNQLKLLDLVHDIARTLIEFPELLRKTPDEQAPSLLQSVDLNSLLIQTFKNYNYEGNRVERSGVCDRIAVMLRHYDTTAVSNDNNNHQQYLIFYDKLLNLFEVSLTTYNDIIKPADIEGGAGDGGDNISLLRTVLFNNLSNTEVDESLKQLNSILECNLNVMTKVLMEHNITEEDDNFLNDLVQKTRELLKVTET